MRGRLGCREVGYWRTDATAQSAKDRGIDVLVLKSAVHNRSRLSELELVARKLAGSPSHQHLLHPRRSWWLIEVGTDSIVLQI
jgi:hypothetical protein